MRWDTGSYANFHTALKNAGCISKVGYSLYLGSQGQVRATFCLVKRIWQKTYGTVATLQHSGLASRLTVTLNSVSGLD